ncbi:MAG: rhomboid family intramembrane serine protease, partial [Candidatus Binatia bacterium]
MIPLRDDQPSPAFPFVTYGLIAANVALFVHELRLGPALEPFVREFGLVPARISRSTELGARFFPFVSSMFLHGGVLHLAGNMLYLHIFGDGVEGRLGHARFLAFYLACGIAAGALQVAMFPSSTLPMVGASGAIAGVTGAYFLFFPFARIVTLVPIPLVTRFVRVPAVLFLFLWFVLQLAYGSATLGVKGANAGGVAWWAHVGGFL